MKAFKVKGKFFMKDRWQEFTKELVGDDDKSVREEIYSRLGSKHRVKRSKIEITEITEIPKKEVTDPMTLFKLNNKKIEKNKKVEKKKKTRKGEGNE